MILNVNYWKYFKISNDSKDSFLHYYLTHVGNTNSELSSDTRKQICELKRKLLNGIQTRSLASAVSDFVPLLGLIFQRGFQEHTSV